MLKCDKGPGEIDHDDGTGTNRHGKMTFHDFFMKKKAWEKTFFSIKYLWDKYFFKLATVLNSRETSFLNIFCFLNTTIPL